MDCGLWTVELGSCRGPVGAEDRLVSNQFEIIIRALRAFRACGDL